MRGKQRLLILLLWMVCSIAGFASGPRLINVSTVAQGNGGTMVTLHTDGAFTHNEYRPADGVLLVDLVGVSAGELNGSNRPLNAPGVKSYHVIGSMGVNGVPVARVELNLAAHAKVRVSPSREGLAIAVLAPPEPVAAVQPGRTQVKTASVTSSATLGKPALAPPPSGHPVEVQDIRVFPAKDGNSTIVEVAASGPLTAHAIMLSDPDRIVLSLHNALPAGGRSKTVSVNDRGVVDVRMGCYQESPPITRVVVDLNTAREFDLANQGGKLSLNVRPPAEGKRAAKTPAGSHGRKLSSSAGFPSASTMLLTDGSSDTPSATPAATAPAANGKSSTAAPGTTAAPSTGTSPISKSRKAAAGTPALAKKSASPVPSASNASLASASNAASAPKANSTSIAPETKGGGSSAQDFVMVQPQVQARVSDKNPNETSPPAQNTLMAQATPPPPVVKPPDAESKAALAASRKAVNFAAQDRQAVPVPEKHIFTGEPISVNLKDVDLKDFFRLIHEISGLNIVLDPNVAGSLTLVLDDVPWDQALDIVLKNNGLDRQLDGNVLRIARRDTLRDEAESRRKQQEAQMLAVDKVTVTRFLSYARAKDVQAVIKRLLSARGDIVADDRTNGLIISDVPSVIPPVDILLSQLDRKTQEVEIEARVVAATRTFAREIGTQLGLNWGNSSTTVSGAQGSSNSSTSSSGTTTSTPLFSNLGATAATSGLSLVNIGHSYSIDAVLTMAESHGLAKVLSRPRVITQNNVQAVVKQGERVPVTTQGQLDGPATTSYVEAVLRLTVTPQITVENTIFLNIDIENTTESGTQINDNPVFLTEQATTQVLVTNGGTVVIGGVVQAKNSVNVDQVPLLGSIPYLGNLFKHRTVSTETQELIFFITPHIIET